jgi:predicted Zn-dependent protease
VSSTSFADLQEIAHHIKKHPRLVIADDFEIAIETLRRRSKSYQNGEEISEGQEQNLWISLRLIHRKLPGRSVTTSASADSLSHLVESAFDSATAASVDPWFRFPLWKQPKNQQNEADAETVDFQPESVYGNLERFPLAVEENYEVATSEALLHRKSEKFQMKRRRNLFSTSFSALSEGDTFFRLSEKRAFSRPSDMKARGWWLEGLVDEAFELSRSVAFPGEHGNSLLVSPQALTILLNRMNSWFCADKMQSGASLLARLGNADPQVFSRAINIMDDGNYPGGVHSSPFDMEGSPSQATLLVEDGELNDFLYDTYAATRENRLSTGNFIRPTAGLFPSILPSNLFILPGTASRLDLVNAVSKGLFLQNIDVVEDVHGSERECVVKGSGWLISNKECTQPVHSVALKLDLLSLFQRADVVGNDLAFFGGFGSPSILFSGGSNQI